MRSQALMLGYYKEPELSKQALTDDGWLKTGDKGALDAEGNLKITGRVKDLFKTSKGKYVAPAPIEDKLVGNPAVEACCVVGANQGQPLALVMLNAEAMKHAQRPEGKAHLSAALSATRQHVNATLDPHEQLACLVVVREPWTVENGFVTPTFKVKRNRVDEVFAARYESWERSDQAVVWE
jgi:long-chain acyl-CoA synthetase